MLDSDKPHWAVRLRSPHSLASLADDFGGIAMSTDVVVCDVAAPENATPHSLVPILHPRAIRTLTHAGAVLVSPELAPRIRQHARWEHPHPRFALANLLAARTNNSPATPGISQHAIIEPNVTIGTHANIGPGAVILQGAHIGDHATIEPRAVIYGSVFIGNSVVIGAGAVIGRPGFGWAHGPDGTTVRMPQLGGVIIEDDVEVGPLATIDAGTLKPTRLRRGCKLDAHVHVGHNTEIGEDTIVAAQTGFAGSVTVGRGVLIGGQVGVADHVTIGDHARLTGRAGVIGNIDDHATVAGFPAVDRMRWLRAIATLMKRRS